VRLNLTLAAVYAGEHSPRRFQLQSVARSGKCQPQAEAGGKEWLKHLDHQSSNLRAVLAPLALAQFICSFVGSNMNVMIADMSEDLDTTVQGIQIAITIFLLVMAALMIPGGKLTDRYGRKRLFMLGLIVYGIGAR
jgi:sugar phosphate permease